MRGAQVLTPEMDVYAFAICCAEILTKGALPWPLMDDDAVRHFVLCEYSFAFLCYKSI
jgi:abelson tyrosine-protein kinase 1